MRRDVHVPDERERHGGRAGVFCTRAELGRASNDLNPNAVGMLSRVFRNSFLCHISGGLARKSLTWSIIKNVPRRWSHFKVTEFFTGRSCAIEEDNDDFEPMMTLLLAAAARSAHRRRVLIAAALAIVGDRKRYRLVGAHRPLIDVLEENNIDHDVISDVARYIASLVSPREI